MGWETIALESLTPPPSPAQILTLKVFISYSRRDRAFADWLVAALERRGCAVLIDRKDLPDLVDWERELLGLIRAADTVVFVVSPNSLASRVCEWEVEQVRIHAKRLAPVIISDIGDLKVPAEISRINYLFFTDPMAFEAGADALARALNTDVAWLREHTRISELARRWIANGRAADALIRGRELDDADSWAARRPREAPVVTSEVLEFLAACRAQQVQRLADERRQVATTRRFQRRAAWGLAGVAILVGYVLLAALWQARETEKREAIVLTSAAAKAMGEADSERTMRIALQAMPTPDRIPLLSLDWDAPEIRAAEARLAGAAQLSRLVVEMTRTDGLYRLPSFSADGKHMFVQWADKLGTFDARTGTQLDERRIPGLSQPYLPATLSADGRRFVVSGADGTPSVREFDSGGVIARAAGPSGGALESAFSPDNSRVVSFGRDEPTYLRVWSPITGEAIADLTGHSRGIITARFDRAGARVVSASYDTTAKVWDASNGTELATLNGHQHFVFDADFSPDGKRVVTASFDRTVRIWDAATGSQLLTLIGHTADIYSARFSPDGRRILSAGMDGTVRLWNAVTGAQLSILAGGEARIVGATFSPDGSRVASIDIGGSLRLWDGHGADETPYLPSPFAQTSTATFSPDETQIVTAGGGPVIALWDMAAATVKSVIVARSTVFGTRFSPDGKLIAVGTSEKDVELREMPKGNLRQTLSGHTAAVVAMAFSPDGTRLATGSQDSTVRMWDVASGRELFVLTEFSGKQPGTMHWINDLAFSPDGSRLVTTEANTENNSPSLRLWDAKTGALIRSYNPRIDAASVAFGKGGNILLVGGWDGVARLVELDDARELVTFRGHSGGIRNVRFSPGDGRVVTGSDDRTVRVWDAASGAELLALRSAGGRITSAELNGSGTRLIVTDGESHRPQIWDTSWLVHARGDDLVRRVCAEKLPGTTKLFTNAEAIDPILSKLAGSDPCQRTRLLALNFWIGPLSAAMAEAQVAFGTWPLIAVTAASGLGALLCGLLARWKRRSVVLWGLGGLLAWIVVLPLLLFMSRRAPRTGTAVA
jgi:WD40 repeat protein